MITMHPAALFKTGNGEVKCTVDMMTRPRGKWNIDLIVPTL